MIRYTGTVLAIVVTFIILAIAPALRAEQQKPLITPISTEQLKDMLAATGPKPLVIDARTPGEFEEVHIKDAINISEEMMKKDPSLLPVDHTCKLVFYCNGVKCGKSKKVAKLAIERGYDNVYVYAEGMPVWEEKGMPIYAGAGYEKKVETSKLKPSELKSIIDTKPGSFTIVDVRDKSEYSAGHIPGAINIPAAVFASGSGVLEKEKRIVVYCNSGGRSYNAYRKLQKLAYPNISQVIFADWEAAGLPVEK